MTGSLDSYLHVSDDFLLIFHGPIDLFQIKLESKKLRLNASTAKKIASSRNRNGSPQNALVAEVLNGNGYGRGVSSKILTARTTQVD